MFIPINSKTKTTTTIVSLFLTLWSIYVTGAIITNTTPAIVRMSN